MECLDSDISSPTAAQRFPGKGGYDEVGSRGHFAPCASVQQVDERLARCGGAYQIGKMIRLIHVVIGHAARDVFPGFLIESSDEQLLDKIGFRLAD